MAPLILGVLVHALAGNLGSLYSVFKDTKGALYSAVAGAVTNIVLNLVFIPVFGMLGAAFTTLAGYIVTLIYRWIDVKKFVNLKLNLKDVVMYVSLICIQFALYYNNNLYSYVIRLCITFFVLILNRKFLLKLIKR